MTRSSSSNKANADSNAPPRRATINDVARLASVSKKTVSRVINRSPFVKEETRAKVNAVIAEVGFTPDPQARGLAFRRAFLVGMIYDNPNAQMVVTMQQGVLDGLRGSGMELVVHPCNRMSKTFLTDVAAFIDRQKLFGVVLLPPLSENDALVRLVESHGCRYVRIGSAVLDAPGSMVVSNDRVVTAEAARHLADLGHRRIGFIAGPKGFRSRKERYDGFLAGLKARGLSLEKELCVDGAYTFESGVDAAEKLLALKPRPTAIFASNDEMAAGVYQVARERNLRIPQDLSVVGFDDTPTSARLWPPLTTVCWPIPDMGRAAAERLLLSIEAPPPSLEPFPAHFVIRQSTASP